MRRLCPTPFLLFFLALGLSACAGPKEFVMKQPPASPSAKEFPEADAVYLLRHRRIRISDDGLSFQEDTHDQIKALNERGVGYIRGVGASYRPPFTKLSNLHARIIRPGGKWISVSRAFVDDASGRYSANFFHGSRWRATGLPHPVPGAVLEYRYTERGTTWFLPQFYFQSSRFPVMRAVVSVSVPKNVPLRFKLYDSKNLPSSRIKYSKRTDPEDSSRMLHTWTATRAPHLEPEFAMPYWGGRAARLHLVAEKFRAGKYEGQGRTWQDISSFRARMIGNRIQPTPLIRKKVEELIKGATTKEEKIRRLYDFVRREIRYIFVGVGLGGWQPQPAEFTLKQRYGDCKAKATLLAAMLKVIGVKAHYVLVRTRNRGPIDATLPDDIGIFNHAINYLPDFKGGMFVDATTNDNRLELLRRDDQGASALIVDGNKGRFVTIPAYSPDKNLKHRRLTLTRKKKHMDGVLTLRWGGIRRVRLDGMLEKKALAEEKVRNRWAKMQIKPMFHEKYHEVIDKELNIQSVQFSGQNEKYLRAEIKFSSPLLGMGSKIVYLNMLPFQNVGVQTLLLKKRKLHPIVFDETDQYVSEVILKRWLPLEFPSNVSINNPHVRYELKCSKTGDRTLHYRRTVTFPKAVIPLSAHESFRQALDQIRESDRRIVILRKGYGDKDKDGIPDNIDACPTTPGPKKFKGCPDRDGDGIIDKDDACPDVKGVPNDDKAKNGCPKVVLVEVTKTEIKILQKIFFRTGSARILRKSYGVLDQVAEVLQSRKDARVRVEGHTDNRGKKKYNLGLSKRRAASVRKYLLNKGIAKDRLESEGYGMSKPIVPNNSRKNRAKNRRVQFTILK